MHEHSHELTLGLSFLLGAAHALEPGHGKSAMLVYLAGRKLSFWHPIVMGTMSAIGHSVSLFLIAFGVHLAHHLVAGDHHHETVVSDVLQWVSALIVMGVGVVLLYRAFRGRVTSCCASHDHASGHHGVAELPLVQLGGLAPSHSQNLATSTESSRTPSPKGYKTTALLGIAVGLMPCPSAVAAYFSGLSSGNPATAYLIVALFAAGIASALSLVGILLQLGGARLEKKAGRLSRLPWNYLRAALILGIGAFHLSRLI